MIHIAVVAMCLACQADAPPTSSATITTAARFDATPERVASARSSLDDAQSRLAPALERSAADAELSEALQRLAKAVEARDARLLEQSLERVDRAVSRLQDARDGAADAELDALRLSLLDARRLLVVPTDASVTSTPQ